MLLPLHSLGAPPPISLPATDPALCLPTLGNPGDYQVADPSDCSMFYKCVGLTLSTMTVL